MMLMNEHAQKTVETVYEKLRSEATRWLRICSANSSVTVLGLKRVTRTTTLKP